MPGRIVMDQQAAIGSQDLKKDRSHAQEGTVEARTPSVQAQSKPHMNGPVQYGANGILPNGIPASVEHEPTTNGELGSMVALSDQAGGPPQLDQSWRETTHNKSLGLLMDRVAGQCYFDLSTTLTEMAEVPVQPQQHQVNGVVPHIGQDTSEGSMLKKRKLMEFAHNQRDRFIKTLVLSDWCRNAEEKARLIDVKVWQEAQNRAYPSCAEAVANTKNNMIPAKMPNPNIEGAMEVLATGKASWVPDLGYIPPKRLTPKQLLKTLRNMNVVLATRLNLHEELPPHFQDFSIADGRATFRVQDEFEVDLSVADEDPSTPFYFIDIRFLFNPSTNILDERLRAFMERKANLELATKGLKGCYDFLHNFVLTHKINVLRTQASELVRGKWFDCVRVESMRRSLVVQYWTGTPGSKSWLEIGIVSGKQKIPSSRRPPTPRIAVRWFRRGVEVKNEAMDVNWRDLSLEDGLTQVIAKHSAWIMSEIQSRLQKLAPEHSAFATEISSVKPSSDDSALKLGLPSMRDPLNVAVEPVTGQISISPASAATVNVERRLNSDPTVDAAGWLAGLLCAAVQDRVRKQAELLGWTMVPNLVRQDNLQAIFGEVVRQFSVFRPSQSWSFSWALVVTFSLGGENWWVVSLEDKTSEDGILLGKAIVTAHRVVLQDESSSNLPVSHTSLTRIERCAVAEVAFDTLSKQLREMRIAHDFQRPATSPAPEQLPGRTTPTSPALFIRFSSLMKPSQNKSWKPWADEMVRLTHHGVERRQCKSEDAPENVRHDLRLSLEPNRMKELHKHVSYSEERNLAMNASGGLALRLLTPFGQPFVEQMQQRLHSVDRLNRYVILLERRQFTCTHVTLSKLAFTYNDAPHLGAELTFSKDGGLPARLKLTLPDSNPHQRIRVFLEKGLNETGDAGFEALTYILGFTLPVLQTFERMETKDLAKQTFSIHPRSSTWYSVKYRAPLPACVFQLRAKVKREGKKKLVRWLIHDMRAEAKDAGLPDDLERAMKELWKESEEHWEGIGNGIVADVQGVAAALEKMDEVVRRFEGHADAALLKPEAAQQSSAGPAKTETSSPVKAETQNKPQKPASTTTTKKEPDVVVLD